MQVIAPWLNTAMSGRNGTDDWRGFFLQDSQNLTYKEMSIVFVICCSDLFLAKHKNDNSSYNGELATQLLEKLLSWNPITYFAHYYSEHVRAAFAG